MTESINELIAKISAFANKEPYIAGGIAIVYLFFMFRKPKKTIGLTGLAVLLVVVALWFATMFEGRNKNTRMKKYEKNRIEQIDKSATEL